MNTTQYTITEAADKLGISAKTLRRWEESGRFSGNRTLGGQRRYSIDDLQILDALSHNIIATDQELLSSQQAAQLAGVTESTIKRWLEEGKLKTFTTANNSYILKPALTQDLFRLQDTPPTQLTPLRPTLPQPMMSEKLTSPKPSWHRDVKLVAINLLLTTSLLASYHLATSLQAEPTQKEPVSGAVQGAFTTTDPKLEILKNLFDSTGNFTTAGTVKVGGQLTTPRFTLSPTTRPISPVSGTIYFDAGTQKLELYNGTLWITLGESTPSTSSSELEPPTQSLNLTPTANPLLAP